MRVLRSESEPSIVLTGHSAPVAALSVAPDGASLASASWDHTVRLWPLARTGDPRVFEGHTQGVNGVAFSPDGTALITAGYDATLRIWPLLRDAPAVATALPAPLNTVVVAPDGEIITAGADGKIYLLSAAGKMRGEIQADASPIISAALSPDGRLIAAASIRGSVAIIERRSRMLVRTLVGPGLPVWSVAFFPDSRTLLSGGTARVIRRWDTQERRTRWRCRRRCARGSACGFCRRSRCRVVSCLCGLPYAARRRRAARRAHSRRGLRSQNRDAARL